MSSLHATDASVALHGALRISTTVFVDVPFVDAFTTCAWSRCSSYAIAGTVVVAVPPHAFGSEPVEAAASVSEAVRFAGSVLIIIDAPHASGSWMNSSLSAADVQPG